ncbi:hypothetical protein BD626DRAFT_509807 [Schizophyllum amplum]|uniref:F-box domain-containing protein n=1 Tax=Schizophyllum amplum TaxID=97359 RepID=A0A550C224_9AGAR|nr:hypothetical protein BD626DRAFT_509807 [Auriculariopsis ampla]
MHEALYTLDILNIILDEAVLRHADLFHCALVCSMWRYVAVPKIWEDIRSTEALFGLLPKETLDPDYDSSEGLPRALDSDNHHRVLPSGWEEFSMRTALAKRFVLDISAVPIDQQWAIAPVVSRASAFPSLRQLVIHGPLQSEEVITVPCLSLLLLDANDRAREVASLQSIETHRTPVSDIISLLHLPRARSLQSICVTGQIANLDTLSSFIEILPSTLDVRTLRELTITRTLCASRAYGSPDRYFLTLVHLECLSVFQRLTRLEFIGVAAASMDDAEYAQCAAWWPELRVFVLQPPVPEAWYPGTCTLSAVEAFARECPSLELLCLPLLYATVPRDFSSHAQVQSSTTRRPAVTIRIVDDFLASMEVSVSTQELNPLRYTRYVEDLASYLLMLFPGLERVTHVGRTPADAGYHAPAAEGRQEDP